MGTWPPVRVKQAPCFSVLLCLSNSGFPLCLFPQKIEKLCWIQKATGWQKLWKKPINFLMEVKQILWSLINMFGQAWGEDALQTEEGKSEAEVQVLNQNFYVTQKRYVKLKIGWVSWCEKINVITVYLLLEILPALFWFTGTMYVSRTQKISV